MASWSYLQAGDDQMTWSKPRATWLDQGMRELPLYPAGLPRMQGRSPGPCAPSSGRQRPGLGEISRGGSRFASVGSRVFELRLPALRGTASKSQLAKRGATPGRARVGARPSARPRAHPATAQGEGRPRQPLRGTRVKPPTNFNCQSDLIGY